MFLSRFPLYVFWKILYVSIGLLWGVTSILMLSNSISTLSNNSIDEAITTSTHGILIAWYLKSFIYLEALLGVGGLLFTVLYFRRSKIGLYGLKWLSAIMALLTVVGIYYYYMIVNATGNDKLFTYDF